ncbi:MAG TPA: ComEA family DNA-binding protein, partial [Bacillales bacterium]|nr:ComEA family DNA-binding protein [Bacillales bacterium]
ETKKAEKPKKPAPVVIDVKGAVKTPGVYRMKKGDRVVDAIDEAGGLLKEADRNRINLAKLLTDQMVVYVPKKGELKQQVGTTDPGTAKADGKVAVNTAGVSELETLPGVGQVKAEAIVAYRKKNGPFKKMSDLLNIPGIGEKSLEALKKHITLQ